MASKRDNDSALSVRAVSSDADYVSLEGGLDMKWVFIQLTRVFGELVGHAHIAHCRIPITSSTNTCTQAPTSRQKQQLGTHVTKQAWRMRSMQSQK